MSELLIENVIYERLSGDSQKNARDLVAFLRANSLTLDTNGDGEGWAVGGTIGNSIGYLLINGSEQMPGPWTIWFNTCDFGESGPVDDVLKQDAWSHASPCGRCHAGWKDCGGGDRTIFGRAFENLCHSPLMFNDPGAGTLENIKKLLIYVK